MVFEGHCPARDSGGISELEENSLSQVSVQKPILKISESLSFFSSLLFPDPRTCDRGPLGGL